MKIIEFLEDKKEGIIKDSWNKLDQTRLIHYQNKDAGEIKKRIRVFYEKIEECIKMQNLAPITDYAKKVAEERYYAGYDLGEVQTAFNCVEEVIWQKIFHLLAADDFAPAISLISTITGSAKDNLARKYVLLVSKTSIPVVDLKELSGYF